MITVKNAEQLELMRKSGKIVGDTLKLLGEKLHAGMSAKELDDIARNYIMSQGAKPSFLGYSGYPASLCVSINNMVVHGIPTSKMIIEEGDIVSLDVGAVKNGYHGDAARTFAVGKISDVDQKLIDVCKESFFRGIAVVKDGVRLGDIGSAIQTYVEANGFSVVRELVGHGIGTDMHEQPDVPNYGTAGRGLRMRAGMTIAIEPMINVGHWKVKQLSDGWGIVTADGSHSAHYENTIIITEDGCEITTL